MSEIAQLMKVMQQEREAQEKRMQKLIMHLAATPATTTSAVPTVNISRFTPFDSTSELSKDYWARANTFVSANFIPKDNRREQ